MLILLLKSTACLAIFLAFYKLVLEKESIHQFKRFFLLGALLASFLIPNMVFTEYVDVTQQAVYTPYPTTGNISDTVTEQPVIEEPSFNWEILLWTVYVLGVVGFGFRFLRHLAQIWSRIRRNPKFKENFIIKVLLRQSLPPHTFFNYIFLNQKQFEEKHIPQEVLLHEETHAKQRHSLDILLIELAQVILWFNPIIYFFKSSIKLNHEFLADRAVINKNNDYSHYQNTILSYLSHDRLEKYQSTGIANAINYSSIKKRFTVMKTNTSKRSFVVKSLLVLPLTALLLFGFSETRQIEREGSIDQIIRMDLLDNGSVQLENENLHFNEIPKILKQNYLQTYDANETKVEINAVQPVHLNTINNLTKEIRTIGIHQIEVFANEVVMDKDQYKENVPITPTTTILNANIMTVVGNSTEENFSQSDLKTYNELAKKYNAIPIEERTIPKNDLRILENIHSKMNGMQRSQSLPFPECLPSNKVQLQQESATREEMKEYNALAKKYNDMDRNHMYIKKQEVMRLKELYGKMSKKQREDAEPFPDFPTPPPAPDAPEPPKNISDTEYASNQIENIIDTQDPYDIVGGTIRKPDNPPTPPEPKSPLEHIKEMANKGATFILNGKEISAKEAIKVLQDNDKINIDSRESNGKKPIVKLSTEPIKIEN